jgi:hypothetical protein
MEGLGQLHGLQSSPDFPAGVLDWESLAGAEMYGDQSASSGAAQTGLVNMGGSGQGPGSTGATSTMSHWSNLLDFKNGPLFWLALATVLYLGLISLHVSAGIGR